MAGEPNTRIHYQYRDGCNCKLARRVVIAGSLTYEQLAPHLEGGFWFIAGQVGLPDPQLEWEAAGYAYPSENDHVWCELAEGDVEATDDLPTVAVTAEELLARFEGASGAWDVEAAMERLGLDCTPVVPDGTRVVRIHSDADPGWRPLVEVPAGATADQLRLLAVRVARLEESSDQCLWSSALSVEELGPLDLRFRLGTRGRWHQVEDGEEGLHDPASGQSAKDETGPESAP